MRGEALLRQLLVFRAGTAVIGVRIDGYPPSRDEKPCHFDVFRIHQLDEVLHDHVDAVLVETSVVAEAEEIELQALALDHPDVRDIGDAYLREIRLTGDRAQSREFVKNILIFLVICLALINLLFLILVIVEKIKNIDTQILSEEEKQRKIIDFLKSNIEFNNTYEVKNDQLHFFYPTININNPPN